MTTTLESGGKGLLGALVRKEILNNLLNLRFALAYFLTTFLLVGSTLDSERIVRRMKRRHPQLMTVQEAADLGVDGFVSMMGVLQI
jgi:hypothetical protein